MTTTRGKISVALAVATVVAALVVGTLLVRRLNDWFEGLPSLAGRFEETLVASVPSPDNKYVAAVFVGDGGATTPFTTLINLRESCRPFATTRQGSIDEGLVFVRKGVEPVKLIWKTPTHLAIQSPLSDICKQERSWNGLLISYQPRRQ